MKRHPIVVRDPEIMGGTAVFYGTRVPVRTLLDYIEASETIDAFLEGFPSVTRAQVVAFLEEVSGWLARNRYTLDQLLADCNPREPLSGEDYAWQSGEPIGREVI